MTSLVNLSPAKLISLLMRWRQCKPHNSSVRKWFYSPPNWNSLSPLHLPNWQFIHKNSWYMCSFLGEEQSPKSWFGYFHTSSAFWTFWKNL